MHTDVLIPSAVVRAHDGALCINEFPGPQAEAGGAHWAVGLVRQPATAGAEYWIVRAAVESGRARACSAGVQVRIPRWSTDCHLVMPGVVYAGNRFSSRKVPYSPKHKPEDCRPDPEPLVSDIVRLQNGPETSRIQVLAGAMAQPAVAAFDPAAGTGWIILAPAHADGHELGFDFRESDDRTSAVLRITTPGVRERRYRHMDSEAASSDRGADIPAGGEITFRLQAHVFACASVQELYDRLFDLRGVLLPEPIPPANIAWEAAFALVEEHYNRDFWWESAGLYGTERVHIGHSNPYQTGWCGGIIAEYALLAGGATGITRERCLRHLHNALTAGIAPSGLFFGKYARDAWQPDCFFENEDYAWRRPLTLVRRQGDALLYALRAIDTLEAQGEVIPQAWLDGARCVARTLVAIWDRNGQFGMWLNQFTAEIAIGGSTSGAIIPAALCAAELRFGGGGFLRVAIAAAEKYYQDSTRRGVTTGGPGDALQCPDSESAYALVEGYMAVYRATHDARWLERAGEAARQFATWVMPYDYRFPPDSLFGRLGIRSNGAVFANAQNGHAAPGICTHSGLGLLELYRATGDARYLRLLRDIARALPQYVSTTERPMVARDGQILPPGWINERCNTSDWDDNLGGVFHGPCWCEVSLLLSWAELRGTGVLEA